MLLRPPTASQLSRAFSHKAQFLRGSRPLKDSDLAPIFVPAMPHLHLRGRRPSEQGPITTVEQALSAIGDDGSVSSDKEPEDVFRLYMEPLGSDQLGTQGAYAENYGGRRLSGRRGQLRLHQCGDHAGSPSSVDLLLDSLLSDNIGAEGGGHGVVQLVDECAYNYTRAEAPHGATAPLARSMAALLRERYAHKYLEREQLMGEGACKV